MEQWIVQVMQSAGQWGFLIILLLMAAENIFPPIPSEVVLTCAGFLTTCSELTRFQAILSATLGSLLGAGTARMPMLPFLLLTAIGTAVWDTVLIGIGAAAGSSWQLAAAKVDYQSALLLMAAFSVAVVVLPLWLLKRKRAKREKERRQKC